MTRLAAVLLVAVGLLVAGAAHATAAPPEDWARVVAGPVVLEGPAAYRSTLEDLAARTRIFLPDLERDLGVQLAGPVLMVLVPPDPSPYPEVERLDAAAPPWAAGFVLGGQRVGAIRIARADRYPFGDAGAVLAHELTHVLLRDAAGPGLPRWFAEGVSTYEQRQWSLRDAMVYSSSLLVGPLPSLRELERAFSGSEGEARLAYAASFDFVDWAAEEYGDGVVRRVLREARAEPLAFDRAWAAATGVPLRESEAAWRRSSLALYRWLPAVTGAGALWIAVTTLFLFAAWRRRVRTREQYERWEEAERPPPPRSRDDGGEWIH